MAQFGDREIYRTRGRWVNSVIFGKNWQCLFWVMACSVTWGRRQMETFSALLALCEGNSTHKGQWRGPLLFSLFCAWTNDWANNRDAGDLRHSLWRHCNDLKMLMVLLPTPLETNIYEFYIFQYFFQENPIYLYVSLGSGAACWMVYLVYAPQGLMTKGFSKNWLIFQLCDVSYYSMKTCYFLFVTRLALHVHSHVPYMRRLAYVNMEVDMPSCKTGAQPSAVTMQILL